MLTTIAPTDEELLEKYVYGKQDDALVMLLSRYEVALFGYCLRLMKGDKTAAKDLYQDSIYKFIEHLQKGRPIDQVNAFFFKIAGGLAVDHFRKLEHAKQYAADLKQELDAKQKLFSDYTVPFADGQLEIDERAWLKEGVEKLSGLQAIASRQFFLEGATYQEIVTDTGQPLSRVKSALQHGKRKLKAWLIRQYRKELR